MVVEDGKWKVERIVYLLSSIFHYYFPYSIFHRRIADFMKIIVTHLSPDLDAVCGVWLVKRFFPGWKDSKVEFVPAGKTLNSKGADEDPSIIHVDTGLGKFDHHQNGDRSICAATLVLDEILRKGYVKDKVEIEALKRLVAVVLDVDHARDRLWPQPASDRWDFMPDYILDGLKYKREDNRFLIDFGLIAMDGVFWGMKRKVVGSKILTEGMEFDSPWGRGIAVETKSEGMHILGERLGYKTIVQKDPMRGNVRIHVHPSVEKADLTDVYEEVQRQDPNSDWFLHATKHLLLNGSRSNPTMRPTKLTLKEVVEIIRTAF